MANPDIGEISCPICEKMNRSETTAFIRRASKGRQKLYVFCPADGQLHMNSAGGQEAILTLGRLYGPEGKPVTEKPVDPVENKPVNVNESETPPPAPDNQGGGWFDKPLFG